MKIDYPFLGYGQGIRRPMVLLNITNPIQNKKQKFWCLLDTGADGCVFNALITDQLGHNLKGDGVKKTVSFGLSGEAVPAFVHTFILELLHPVDKEVIWSSGAIEVKCVENKNMPPILGTENFLNNFVITFDYENQLSTLYI